MKTTVIVGSTRDVARERLELMRDGGRIKKRMWYDEATSDGSLILAMDGAPENICWLRGLGLHIEEIIIVKPDGISEEMGKYINYVRSAIEWQRRARNDQSTTEDV